jgi:hypothetical protein
MTTTGNNYPKMLTTTVTTAAGTSRTVPLVFPFGQNHPKQGTFVIFNSAADEASYDGTGVAASSSSGVIENRHHT